MARQDDQPTTTPPLVLQTVAWAKRQGFKPVLLHHQSKAATSRAYASPDYSPPDDDVWRSGCYGVGIVTGPQQKGPLDVDLDCDEALFFAPRFFPPTPAIFGRAGKPRSHFLYRLDCPAFDKVAYMDPGTADDAKLQTIIELRGDGGHQTVFPGSTHQDSGEVIEWAGVPFPEVPVVSPEVLSLAARKVAIATLIVRHIWAAGYHNEPTKHLSGLFFYLGWTCDEAVEMIEALMAYSGDDDKSRIPTVRATFRRAGNGTKVTGAGRLRKEVSNDPVIDKLLEWAGSPTINLLQEYNERFAVVNFEGKFRIGDTDVPAGEAPVFYGRDDFIAFQETDTIEIDGKKLPKARLWLNNPRRRTHRSVEFMPGQEESSSVFNLWTGWAIKPEEGECSAWLELVRDVICGGIEDDYRWLLNWFANIVREPMSKSMTAPVFVGEPGAGKSLCLSYFGRVLGPAYIVVTNEEHVYGKFNKHMSTGLLLHSEEALFGGDKRHRGIIKSLITDEFRIFEQKGIDARPVHNYLRVVLTSNEDNAAPVDPNDRRFSVFDLKKRRLSDDLRLRVIAERANGGPAALFHHLLHMDYDPELVRTNIKNDALREMKSTHFTPLQEWWYTVLQSGHILPDFLAWAQQPEREDWTTVVGSPALYTSMVISMRNRGVRSIPSDTVMALQLNKFVGDKLTRARRQFLNPQADGIPQMARELGDRQQAIVNMPTLDGCRTAFEKFMGQTFDWPNEGDEPEIKIGDNY